MNVKVRAASGGHPAKVEVRTSRSGPVVLEATSPAGELDAIQRLIRCIDGLLADRAAARAAETAERTPP